MTYKLKKHSIKGFTLIELLLVMILMGIVSVALTNFIVNWLQTSSIVETRANLLNKAELAMDEINNDIVLSGGIAPTNTWPDPNGPGGNEYGWTSNSQTMILEKVATDSSDNPIFIDSSDYITQKDNVIYYLSGTDLYRRTLKSDSSNDAAVTTCPPSDATSTCPPDTLITNDVSGFNITYYDDNNNVVSPDDAQSVEVSLTLTSPYGNANISQNYTTRMVFRND